MERQVLVYDTQGNKDIVVYLNETVEVLSAKKFYRKYKYNSDYCCVKRDHRGKKKDPQELMREFIKDARLLRDRTEGRINMFMTPDFTKCAKKLFLEMNYGIDKKFEEFQDDEDLDEALLIEDTTTGAIMHCEKYNGIVYQYDFISFYPSILRHRLFYIPVKPPMRKKISRDQFEKMKSKLKYGIYKVKISNFDNRIFRENKNNLYTHFDINFAVRQNYKIELIEDVEINFYDYSNSLIRSDLVFKEFVDYVFKLKEEGYKNAKNILNCLWGYLCETEKTLTYAGLKERVDIETGNVLNMLPCDNDDDFHRVESSKTHKMVEFKTKFARLKPFLLAKGRMRLGDIAVNNLDNIVYMHTDCIVLKNKIDNKNICNVKDEIGYLKKKKGSMIIVNITNYDFFTN